MKSLVRAAQYYLMTLLILPLVAQANPGRTSFCQQVFNNERNLAVTDLAHQLNVPNLTVLKKVRDQHRQHLFFEINNKVANKFTALEVQELAWKVLGSPRNPLSLRNEEIETVILLGYLSKISDVSSPTANRRGPGLVDWLHLANRSHLIESETFLEKISLLARPTFANSLTFAIQFNLSEGVQFSNAEKLFMIYMLKKYFAYRLFMAEMNHVGFGMGTLDTFWVAADLLPLTKIQELKSMPEFIQFIGRFSARLRQFAERRGLGNHVVNEVERSMGFIQ